MLRQPGLGVVVMKPYVGDDGCRSTGPKHAMPRASYWRSASQSQQRRSVSAGEVVGNSARSITFAGSGSPTAIATTNVVPPPSTAASRRAISDAIHFTLVKELHA